MFKTADHETIYAGYSNGCKQNPALTSVQTQTDFTLVPEPLAILLLASPKLLTSPCMCTVQALLVWRLEKSLQAL